MVAYNYLSVSFKLTAGLEMPGGIPGIAAPLIAWNRLGSWERRQQASVLGHLSSGLPCERGKKMDSWGSHSKRKQSLKRGAGKFFLKIKLN